MNRTTIAILAPLFLGLAACSGSNEEKDIGITPESLVKADQKADQANVFIFRKWTGQNYINNEIKTRRDCFNEAHTPVKNNNVKSAFSSCYYNSKHIGSYYCKQNSITKAGNVSTYCTEQPA